MYFQESFKYNKIFIFATTQGINYIIFYQGMILFIYYTSLWLNWV